VLSLIPWVAEGSTFVNVNLFSHAGCASGDQSGTITGIPFNSVQCSTSDGLTSSISTLTGSTLAFTFYTGTTCSGAATATTTCTLNSCCQIANPAGVQRRYVVVTSVTGSGTCASYDALTYSGNGCTGTATTTTNNLAPGTCQGSTFIVGGGTANILNSNVITAGASTVTFSQFNSSLTCGGTCEPGFSCPTTCSLNTCCATPDGDVIKITAIYAASNPSSAAGLLGLEALQVVLPVLAVLVAYLGH